MTTKIKLKHENMKPKILLVSYAIPPISSPGSLRVKFFAKYLPEFGLHPCILTARNGYSTMISSEVKLENICSSDIIKAQDPILRLKKNLKNNPEQQSKQKESLKQKSAQKAFNGIVKRIKSVLLKINLYPDHQIVWLPFAILHGIIRLSQRDIKVIYSTYPSLTNHLVGLVLSYIFNLKWVVEFRDLFTNEVSYKRTGILKSLDKYLESLVLRKAHLIVVVSKGLKEDLVGFDTNLRKKTIIVYNGYDQDESKLSKPNPRSQLQLKNRFRSKVNWLYTGSFLNGDRSPHSILKAIHNVSLVDKIDPETFGLLYAGNDNKYIIEEGLKYSVNSYLKPLGMLSRSKVLEQMSNASRLITISRNSLLARSELTTKIFEYIGSGKPLLTITNHSFELAAITKSSGGVVADFNDIKTIEQTLLTDLASASNPNYAQSPSYTFYSRREQAKILATKIKELLIR